MSVGLVQSKDNVPEERTTGPLGAVIPEAQVIATEVAPAVYVEPVLQNIDVRPAGVQPMHDKLEKEMVTMSTFPSIIAHGVTPVHRRGFWYSQKTIDSWSKPEDFFLRRLDLAEDLIQPYRGTLYNVEEEAINTGQVNSTMWITKPGALGFNTYEWAVTGWDRYNLNAKLEEWRMLQSPTSKVSPVGEGKYKIKHTAFCFPEEKAFVDLAEREAGKHLMDTTTMWSVLEHLNTPSRYLKRIDDSVPVKFMKSVYYEPTDAILPLLRGVKPMRDYINNSLMTWITNSVPLVQGDPLYISRKFSELLSINHHTDREQNSLPDKLNYSEGADLFRKIIMSSMNRMTEIVIDIDLSIYDIANLVGCIYLKLLVPYHCMNPRSADQIDNYLYYHLMPNLSMVNPTVRTRITESMIASSDVILENKLSALLDLNNVFRATEGSSAIRVAEVFRNFLYTDGHGSGWAAGSTPETVPLSTDMRRFVLPSREVFYVPFFGQATLARVDRIVRFEQLQQLMWIINERQTRTGIQVALQFLAGIVSMSTERVRSFRLKGNEVLRHFSLNAMMLPSTTESMYEDFDVEERSQPAKTQFQVAKPFSAISMAFMIDWDKHDDFELNDLDILQTSLAINKWFTDVTRQWYITEQLFPKQQFPLIKRSELYRRMVERLPKPVSISHTVLDLLGAKPWLYDLTDHLIGQNAVRLDTDFRFQMLTRALNWIDREPELFGYCNGWYLVKACAQDVYRDKEQMFDIQYRIKEGIDIVETISYSTLFKNLNVTRNYIMDKVNTLKHNQAIYFNFKVKLEASEIGINDQPDLNSWIKNFPALLEGDSISSGIINKLTIRYRLDDVNDPALPRPTGPNWWGLVPMAGTDLRYPYQPENDSRFDFMRLKHTVVAWRENTLKLYNEFKWSTRDFGVNGPEVVDVEGLI